MRKILNKYTDIFTINKEDKVYLNNQLERHPLKCDVPIINSNEMVEIYMEYKPNKILFVDGDNGIIKIIDSLIYLQNVHIYNNEKKFTILW